MNKRSAYKLSVESLDDRIVPSATSSDLSISGGTVAAIEGVVANTDNGIITDADFQNELQDMLFRPGLSDQRIDDMLNRTDGQDQMIEIQLLGGPSLSIRQRVIKSIEDSAGFNWGTSAWTVHHLFPQAMFVADKVTREFLNDFSRLRLIPDAIKGEIDALYTAWARKEAAALGIDTTKQGWEGRFWKKVPVDKVQEFAKKVDETYGHLMIKPNASKADARKVFDIADAGEASRRSVVLGSGSRALSVLGKTAGAVGLLALFGNSAATAAAIAQDGPESRAAWQAFEQQYKSLLAKELSGGTVSYFEAQNFVTAFNDYLIAIKVDDGARSKIVAAMRTWIDANIVP